MCARKAYSKTFYPPPAERGAKKNTSTISQEQKTSLLLLIIQQLHMFGERRQAGGLVGGAWSGTGRGGGQQRAGNFRGGKKNCDVINA